MKIMLFSQVNQALMNLINASKSKHKPQEWSHIPERETGIYNLSIYIENFAKKALPTIYQNYINTHAYLLFHNISGCEFFPFKRSCKRICKLICTVKMMNLSLISLDFTIWKFYFLTWVFTEAKLARSTFVSFFIPQVK